MCSWHDLSISVFVLNYYDCEKSFFTKNLISFHTKTYLIHLTLKINYPIGKVYIVKLKCLITTNKVN